MVECSVRGEHVVVALMWLGRVRVVTGRAGAQTERVGCVVEQGEESHIGQELASQPLKKPRLLQIFIASAARAQPDA